MQKITPHLWFDNNAEEAMNYYVSVFPNSKIINLTIYPEGSTEEHLKGMEGKVLNGQFELDGFQFQCLDGGPMFQFNPSVSFFVNCTTKDQVDTIWGKLSADGNVLMELGEYPFSAYYGWIQDTFGVSWQIIQSKPEGGIRPYILPSLMFIGKNTGKAKDAMEYYVSIFPDSQVGTVSNYPEGAAPDPDSKVAYEDFTLANQSFAAMDSGTQHDFNFNEAISLIVDCQDQAEIDHFWEKLSANPEAEQCGWCKDKFGVSWQIVPRQLGELLSNPDKNARDRVMHAMLQMKKIDIAALQAAANGSESHG